MNLFVIKRIKGKGERKGRKKGRKKKEKKTDRKGGNHPNLTER